MSRLQSSPLPILAVTASIYLGTRLLDGAAADAADQAIFIHIQAHPARLEFAASGDALDTTPAMASDDDERSVLIDAARQLAKQGRVRDAIALLETEQARQPSAANVVEIAKLCLSADDPQAALGHLEALPPAERRAPSASFLEGVAQSAMGDQEAAVAAYQRVLASSPQHYEANYNLGLLRLEQGDLAAAEARLTAAVDSAGGQRKARALFALGVAYGRTKAVDKAERAYRRAIDFDPQYILPRINLAILLGEQDRAAAEALLDVVLKLEPDYAPALFAKARLASRANEDERALRLYLRAERSDPTFYKARYNAALLLADKGRLEQARQAFTALTRDFSERREPWFNLGQLAYRKRDYEGSRKAYARALELASGDYPEAELNLALVDRAEDKLEKARARLDALIERHPAMASALVNRGLVRRDQGDLEGARHDFEAAAQAAPSSLAARFNLAKLQSEQGDLDGAAALYRAILARAPHHRSAALNLGVLLMDRKDYPGAASAFEAVLTSAPHDEKATYNLGRLASKQGDWAAAARHYEAVLKRNPEHLKALRNLAVARAKLGDDERAISLYREALDADPSQRSVHLNLALALKRQDDVYGAAEALDRCIKLSPRYWPCLRSRAILALDANDADKASTLLADRITKAPADAQAVYARALHQQGQHDTEREWAARAAKRAPDDAEVRKALRLHPTSSPPAP